METELRSRRCKSPKTHVVGLSVALSFAVAGCGGLNVANLPLPKPNPGAGGYVITASFDSVLNLPKDARVKVGGNNVGTVTSIKAVNYEAEVRMQIARGVVLPAGTTAELRQPTPLGDVFIALEAPLEPIAGQPLADGSHLDRASTKAGATVEELLTQASMLINGGALTQAVSLLNDVSSMVAGKDQTLVNVVNHLTTMIHVLNNRTASLDGTLNQTTTLLTTLNENKKQLGQVADSLPDLVSVLATNNQNLGNAVRATSNVTDALGDYARTSTGATNALLASVDRTMSAITSWGDKLGATADQIHQLEANARTTTEGTGIGAEVIVANLTVGALYDTGSRVPSQRDVDSLVISMAYTLQKAYARFAGSNR